MSTVKKTISISEELIAQSLEIAPNFSSVVEAALVEYIHHARIKKALGSFGAWEGRAGDSVKLVNQLREESKRAKHRANDSH